MGEPGEDFREGVEAGDTDVEVWVCTADVHISIHARYKAG